MRVVKAFAREDRQLERFARSTARVFDQEMIATKLSAYYQPLIGFLPQIGLACVLLFGGRRVVSGHMTLGDFTAFNSYLAILIFPVILIGFMSNVMAQAGASYARIGAVLGAPAPKEGGGVIADLRGDVTLSHIVVKFGERAALDDVSLSVKAGTRTAVIGPTAAGKTQLLFLLTGLLAPTTVTVSATLATSIWKVTSCCTPSVRLMFPTSLVLKPGNVAVTL